MAFSIQPAGRPLSPTENDDDEDEKDAGPEPMPATLSPSLSSVKICVICG
jgi:hypothetical protein